MKSYRRIALPLLAALLLFAVSSTAMAYGVRTGFIATNPQIFAIGDLVNLDQIEGGEDFDWDSLPDIIFFQISANSEQELDAEVIVRVSLRFGSVELIDWWSRAFTVRDWVESYVGSNGYYSNRQLGRLQNEPWIGENSDRSHYAESADFLSVLDGSNISAGIASVRIELFQHDGGDVAGIPLAVFEDIIQVYNPSPPELQQPMEGAEISSYPIFFSWNWSGGVVTASNVELVIVEGSPGDNPETVIQSRNPNRVRYAGPPQLPTSHTYTGIAGEEEALEEGATYFWQVRVYANTAIPGDAALYESNISSFIFTISSSGEGLAGHGQGHGGARTDPVLNQLNSLLPSDIMENLTEELEGYFMTGIVIDGVGGYEMQELRRMLNPAHTTVVSVTVD